MASLKGKFVWYELTTTDMAAAETFYKTVIAWSARDAGVSGMRYTLFTIGEMPVAGMMALPPQAGGAQPGWIGYVAVDDADASTHEAKESGGTVCHAPQDIPGVGRFAVVSDPQNTVLALFKPLPAGEQDSLDPRTPGRIGWHELHAADGPSAFGFYEKLFGWTKGDGLDMGPMGIYQIFNCDNIMAGGMFTKMPMEPVPYWLFYINVEEINAALERVKSGGGQVLNGPTEVPGGSMVAQCLDPQGVIFAIVEPR